MDERKTGSFHLTGAGQSGGSTDDAVALDFPLPGMPLTSGWPAYGAKFNWADMRVYARAAVLADRELRTGQVAPDLLDALQGFYRNSVREDWPDDLYDAAEAAIAKATERSAEPTRAGTERHTRNEPDPESGISPGSSIPVERGMV